MPKLNSNLKKFLDTGYDTKRWNYLYHKYPQEYIRKRLKFLEQLYESKKIMDTIARYKTTWSIAQKWLSDFNNGGLDKVCTPITRKLKQKLSLENKQKLKKILLTKTPQDYGFDRYIWTGKVLEQLIKQEFNIELKDSRVYEILHELNFSHQKAHRDYSNADRSKQQDFQESIKKNLTSNKIWKNREKK